MGHSLDKSGKYAATQSLQIIGSWGVESKKCRSCGKPKFDKIPSAETAAWRSTCGTTYSSGVWSDILVLVRGVEDLGRHGVWTKIAERPYLRYICSSLQQWGIGDTCEDGSSKWYSMQVLKMLRKKTEYEIKTSLSSFLLLLYCMSPNPSTLALQQS